jgi:sugar lactone lactonase YvrE
MPAVVPFLVAGSMVLGATENAPEGAIPFTDQFWDLSRARVVEHLGRSSLAGTAFLKDAEFRDGVIEVDMATTEDTRSYPGVLFRVTSPGDFERFYVRPHRAPLYPDALQYVPSFRGISGWQLYNGPGYTAVGPIPHDVWVPVRIEVRGSQARVLVGSGDPAVLEIPHLEHGEVAGGLGLLGPMDGTAYFSEFRYRADDTPAFLPPPPREAPPGMIVDWELSRSMSVAGIDLERHPSDQDLPDLRWSPVTAGPTGLVDVARHAARTGPRPDCVFARTTLHADGETVYELNFGYSDAVALFLDGRLLFTGNSAYRLRDPSFLGIVGLHDTVYLPLTEGDHELLLTVVESFGGWGFQAQDGTATFVSDHLERVWETEAAFEFPETVVHDPASGALFVSNYDAYDPSRGRGAQSIARLATDGTIDGLNWATGLNNPTGLAVGDGRLYVVERSGLALVDLASGEVVERVPVPRPAFLNDVAVDEAGNVYLSDSGAGIVYRLVDGEMTPWLRGPEVVQPNGLAVRSGELLFGNNGDSRIKAADLDTGEIRTVARVGPGTIDGIEVGPGDDLLVSIAEGKLYRLSAAGEITRLLDTSTVGVWSANFAYLPGAELVVVPTFADDRVVAYRLRSP